MLNGQAQAPQMTAVDSKHLWLFGKACDKLQVPVWREAPARINPPLEGLWLFPLSPSSTTCGLAGCCLARAFIQKISEDGLH